MDKNKQKQLITEIMNKNAKDELYQKQTACNASQDELKQSDLKHYDKLSTECHHWSNGVPRAIEFYYEYQKMTLFQKIKLAFTTKTKR